MNWEHWCWSQPCNHHGTRWSDWDDRTFLGPWKGSGVTVHEDDGYYYGDEN